MKLDDLSPAIRSQVERQLSAAGKPAKAAPAAGVDKPKAEQPDSPPHDLLWQALSDLPGVVREYAGAVPGRRYRLDIAFPAVKLAVEIDGWQYHGKFKEAHSKDRERQNLLVLNGWQVLRFSAGQVFNEHDQCVIVVLKKLAILQQSEIKRIKT